PVCARVLLALVAIGGGGVLMLHTFTSLATMIVLIAAALIVSAAVEFVRAGERRARFFHILLGSMWIIAALLVLTVPVLTIRALVLIVGVGLIVHGAVQLLTAVVPRWWGGTRAGTDTLASSSAGMRISAILW